MDNEQADRERARQIRLAAFQRDAEPVEAALAAAGIDTRDFARFVNRPFPGVIEPSHFDAVRAMPVLLEWLPRVTNEDVRQVIVRRLAVKTRDGAVADALITELRRPGSAHYKWVVADSLAFACDKRHFAVLTELAADESLGPGRAPLVGMQWRIKTEAADRILLTGISDPDVVWWAMSALRRRFGSDVAREHIRPLVQHDDARVSSAAARQLRRIDKKLAGRG